MKHLKHVLASEDVSGADPSSRGTSPLPPSPSPYPTESPDRTLKPGDQIEVDDEEKDEGDEEIFFPFIKEGTVPECPPPPPPSPCSPLLEDVSSPPATEVQQTQDAPNPAIAPPPQVVKEFDDDEDDDWMQPTQQLPPQPKWDFDAVRDSVSSWSSKATFEPTPRAVPPPPEPLPQEEEPKNYDHVLGGIVNQFINTTDDFVEPPPERVPPQEDVLLPPANPYLMVNYEGQQSFDQIQMAMGATDEEMAMLENLGSAFEAFVYDNSGATGNEYEEAHPGSSATLVNLANTTGPIEPLENADIMDLDNQVSDQPEVPAAPSVEEMQPVANKYAAK